MSDRFTPEQMIQVRQLYGLSSVVGAAHDLDPFSPDQEKVARICAAFGILIGAIPPDISPEDAVDSSVLEQVRLMIEAEKQGKLRKFNGGLA